MGHRSPSICSLDPYEDQEAANMTNRSTLTEVEVAFVHSQRVARLATADAEGKPHVIPVCYAFDGTYFYTPLDEKPKRVSESKLRRGRNIAARPVGALVFCHND